MKRLFFLLLNWIWLFSSYSQTVNEYYQQHFELNESLSGTESHHYHANDYIKLLPGFSYTPQSGSSFYLKGQIDSYTPMPVVYAEEPINVDTRTLDYDLPVGTSAGSASVSLSGAATYQMPIVIPPGTAGMEPAISLVYNSQGGNGIMGYGWNLSGLSAITRVPQTIYHDEQVKGVDFVDDRFALDGNRLIVITGSYGAANSVYYTEVFNASRITAYNTAGGGPEHFVVETKDGKKVFYGQTQDSRIEAQGKSDILIWNINRIEDRLGNYIEFSYHEEGTQYWIEEIRFTGNDSSVPPLDTYNKIHFFYSERQDKSVGFIAGSRIEQNVILTKIKTYAGSELVRKYDLNYYLNPSENVIYSHLIEVKESNGEGESFNSTVFEWENIVPEPDYGGTFGTALQWDKFYGDFNGDGKTDYLTANWEIECDIKCYTNYVLYENFPSSGNIVDQGQFPYRTRLIIVGDYNGDGIDDLILPRRIESPSQDDYYYRKWLSEPEGYSFNKSEMEFACATWIAVGQTEPFRQFQSLDLNGDNRDDIVFNLRKEYDGAWGVHIMTDIFENYISCSSTTENEFMKFGDFNGNGKSDIMTVYDTDGNTGYRIYEFEETSQSMQIYSSGGYPTPYHDIFTGDFNGDGKTDILTWSESGQWELKYFTENYSNYEWEAFAYWPGDKNSDPSSDPYDINYHVADFNGDGKAEILEIYDNWVGGGASTATYNIFSYNGSTFSKYNMISDIYSISFGKDDFADFNGDGCLDFITGPHMSTSYTIFYFYTQKPTNYITIISNGLNYKTSFEYLPLTDPDIYTKYLNAFEDNGGLIRDIQGPLYLVKNLKFDNGIGEERMVTFKYEGARVHRLGKGFLGFQKIIKSSEIFDLGTFNKYNEDVSIYSNPAPYYNLTFINHSVRIKTILPPPGGETYETVFETQNNYNNKTGYENSGLVFLPFVESSVSHDYKTTLESITTNSIDNYGNVLQSIIDLDGEGSKTKVIEYDSPGSWCDYLPDYIIEEQQFGEEPLYHTETDLIYNSIGLLLQEKVFADLQIPVITDFDHDDWGNVILKTVSSGGMTPRSESFEYDENRHHFLITNTNITSHTSHFTYDETIGNIKTNTDINGLITKYNYDGFGRLIKTEYPDGNNSVHSVHWDAENPNENVLYYTMNVIDGTPTTKVYFDILGREVLSGYENLENVMVMTKKNYNNNGQLISLSEPYFEGNSPTQWTNYTYDEIGRTNTVADPTHTIVYDYNGKTTTVQNIQTGISKTTTINPFGLTANVTDPGGTITYTYYSSGLPHTITSPSSGITTMTYDDYGRQTDLNDPDAGNTHYDYWPSGELAMQTDAKGNIFYMNYDDFGRLDVKWDNTGEIINYSYVEEGNGLEMIESIVHSNGTSYLYEYDEFSRLIKKTEIVDGQNYETEYTYDEFGNIATIEYPSGFNIENHYEKGYLTEVFDLTNQTLLYSIPANAYNAKGQLTDYYLGNTSNGIHAQKGYDQYGFPTSITTGTVQDLEYDFDPATCNLNYRKDNIFNLQEDFTYIDAFKNRLNTWSILGGPNFSAAYYDNGNINTKSDLGTYDFNDPVNFRPHAVYRITDPVSLPAEINQEITYNTFNSVKKIEHINQNKKLEFIYGPDKSRKKTVYSQNDVVQKTKYFIGGLYEKEVDAQGNVREIHYIPGGDGLLALYIKVNGIGTMYYVLKDHLGSLYAITDAAGNIVTYNGQPQRFSFDPWGNRRNPTNWTFNNVPTQFLIDRGFTGHEHLDVFELINMNGRLYDPVLGRMLSPDNFIQAPDNSQGLNRYSYCFNNPLVYTDPDGEWVNILFGAVLGGFMGYISGETAGAKGWDMVGYIAVGAAVGAVTSGVGSAVSAGIGGGSIAAGFIGAGTQYATGFAAGFVSGAAAGFTGGFLGGASTAWLSGENLGDGLVSGLEAGGYGAATGAILGGVLGGIDAAKQNQNFWTGAPKQNVVTNGERTISSKDYFDNVQFSKTQRGYELSYEKSDLPFTLEVKLDHIHDAVPIGYRAPRNHYPFYDFSYNKPYLTIDLPYGTSSNGSFIITGWKWESSVLLQNFKLSNLFYTSKNSFSPLFFYLWYK